MPSTATKDDEVAQMHNVLEKQKGEIQHLNQMLEQLTKQAKPVEEPPQKEVGVFFFSISSICSPTILMVDQDPRPQDLSEGRPVPTFYSTSNIPQTSLPSQPSAPYSQQINTSGYSPAQHGKAGIFY